MPKPKIIFPYLQGNMLNAIRLIREKHENLLLGGFSCAVIELLGRCLVNPQSKDGQKNFNAFIKKFLQKQNPHYEKYKSLLRLDLRNGAAHSLLPKGFVTLSFSEKTEDLHLKLVEDINTNKYHLWIYSVQFLKDLEQAIIDFISEAQKNPNMTENYLKTLKQISQEDQDAILETLSEEDIKTAIKISIKGDIYPVKKLKNP